MGRSPLARGRRMRRRLRCFERRSIPARAGQTGGVSEGFVYIKVDPRSRGADITGYDPDLFAQGRSPLARGRLAHRRDLLGHAGSIPARAGQTHRRGDSRHPAGVDPRSRGADWISSSHLYSLPGRSPLARGRHDVATNWLHVDGSIPARAGQTIQQGPETVPNEVDPRSRGADRGCINWMGRTWGRSPLARGRLRTEAHRRAQARSIPARAGQTLRWVLLTALWQVDPRSRGADA